MADHSKVRVLRAVESDESRNGKHLYELQPTSYSGPWELEPGTVLQIVSTPKEKKNDP